MYKTAEYLLFIEYY